MSNSLGNISNINLDSFKTDATYYLSKSGEVKKAGLWFNFKLWTNIGNSRNKVFDLLNAVKDKMVSATDSESSIKEFEDSIKKDKCNVKLSTLLQNFKANNAKCIHGEEAKKIAESRANFIAMRRIPCDSNETCQELKKFLFKTLSSFYNNPPLKNNEDGKGKVLDEDEFDEQTRIYMDKIEKDLMEKLETGKLKDCRKDHFKLDSMYLKYYEKNLFERDGTGLTRNNVKLGDIKPKKDAFVDSLVSNFNFLDEEEKQYFLDKEEQFSKIADHLKSVLDETQDGLLKNILTKSVKEILVNDNGNLRALDEVKEKIKDITNNFYDLTFLKCKDDTSKKIAGEFLSKVGIKKLTEGSAKKVFEMIKTEAPKLFGGISGNPSPKEISKLMGDIQLNIDKIAAKSGILYANTQFAREAVRTFILGEMISNLSPDDQEKVFNMTNSFSFAKVYTILGNHKDDVNRKMDFSKRDDELFKQQKQKYNNGVLLKRDMAFLKDAAFTVANPDKFYIPTINRNVQDYVGIDMKSEMANTVIENSGMDSNKFNDSVLHI